MPDKASQANRAYPGGHFNVTIDGHKDTAYLKSLDGGWVKTNVMEEAVGSNQFRGKHSSVAEIEPITAELGILGSGDMLKWMQGSWNRNPQRRHGQCTHANFNLRQTFTHEFWEALLLEATIPSLDGASKEPGWLKVKWQPERIVTTVMDDVNGPKLPPVVVESGQKLWSCANFRFTIDGVAGMEKTKKIESFTIKQGVKKHYMGMDRMPQIEPTKIDFPNLQGQIALHHAGNLIKWYQQFVQNDKTINAPDAQKTGSIEFLDPSTGKTIFRIGLHDIGIVSLNIPGASANQDVAKQLKYELYVGWMDIEVPNAS
ncbi:MAG TPA: phage tail protein [Kofleriaceae bacterium]|jgi:hypothetical protein